MTEAREWWCNVFNSVGGHMLGNLRFETKEAADKILAKTPSWHRPLYRLHIRLKPSKETK